MNATMPSESNNRQSHLFTLRLWTEDQEDENAEWRGRLHCVTTDEIRYFQDWPSLIPLLLNMLREAEDDGVSAMLSPGKHVDGEG